MLVEPPNQWEGSLLPSRLHGSITLIARLVDSTFSLRPFSTVESHSAYLSVIFSGGAQIHEHLHVAFDWFPGLQSCKNRSEKKEKLAYVHLPSSSFTRYWSNIGSAFTTCCAAKDLMDARFAWNSFDSKYLFQNSSEVSYRTYM